MRRDKEAFDPTQPALLVTYGNTAKKHRHLDGEVIVLGRSNVCDFSLVSPEVAPIHCVLVRVAGAWKLRDCSGRPGTRVNGKVIQEVVLDDGDIIQIGAFSFQAHLPPGHVPGTPPIAPSLVEHLQRSRARLAERALHLRRELRKRTEVDASLAARESDLAQQVEVLRGRNREHELRMTRLELSERDLATDRATLEKEYRTLQEEIERHALSVRVFKEESARRETELTERQTAIQGELEALSQQWQQRNGTPFPGLPCEKAEQARELDLRARELDHFARHLRRQRQSAPDSHNIETKTVAPAPAPSPVPALELLAQIVDASREQHEEMERLLDSLRDVFREAGQREFAVAE